LAAHDFSTRLPRLRDLQALQDVGREIVDATLTTDGLQRGSDAGLGEPGGVRGCGRDGRLCRPVQRCARPGRELVELVQLRG
jgi:hypothetical protein